MEKLKIGVAGLGRIGKIHLENLLQINNVEVISCYGSKFGGTKIC